MSVAVCSGVPAELKGQQAADQPEHIYLHSTDVQNCHLIPCGTLKVGTAPAPGDRGAVGVKLGSLTLIRPHGLSNKVPGSKQVISCKVIRRLEVRFRNMAKAKGIGRLQPLLPVGRRGSGKVSTR